jgi:hypothetical protein
MIIAQLPEPIGFINTTATQVAWMVTYPSNTMYYVLQNQNNTILKDGNWLVPNEVIQAWGPDDSVVSDALIAAAPWNYDAAAAMVI